MEDDEDFLDDDSSIDLGNYDDVTGNFLDTFQHFNFSISEEAYYDNPWFDCLSEDEAVAAWENTM